MRFGFVALAVFLVLLVAWIGWAALHGFDPDMCEAHGACGWRYA